MKEKFWGEILVGLAAFVIATLTTAFTPLGEVLRELIFPTTLTVEGYVLRGEAPTAAHVMLDGREETRRETDLEGQFYFVDVIRGEHCYSVMELSGSPIWVDNFYIAPGSTEKTLVTSVDVVSANPRRNGSLNCRIAPPELLATEVPASTLASPAAGFELGATPMAGEVVRVFPTFEVIFGELRTAEEPGEIAAIAETGELTLATAVSEMSQDPSSNTGGLRSRPSEIEFARAVPTLGAIFTEIETISNPDDLRPFILEGDIAVATVQAGFDAEAGVFATSVPESLDYTVSLKASSSPATGDTASDAVLTSVSVAAEPEVAERIERVTYYLDPSFSPSVVTRDNQDEGFALVIAAGPTFDLVADVLFDDQHLERITIPIGE